MSRTFPNIPHQVNLLSDVRIRIHSVTVPDSITCAELIEVLKHTVPEGATLSSATDDAITFCSEQGSLSIKLQFKDVREWAS